MSDNGNTDIPAIIRGKVMAIETGVLTFEGAFLGQILLPTGKTILESAISSKLLMLEGAPA